MSSSPSTASATPRESEVEEGFTNISRGGVVLARDLQAALASLSLGTSTATATGLAINTPVSSVASSVASPVDMPPFWEQYSWFTFDPAADPNVEFGRLAAREGWGRQTNIRREKRAEFNAAVSARSLTKLEKWQQLCREVRVPMGPSIKQCKLALKKVNVNITDLMAARRNHRRVETFSTVQELIDYTFKNNKTYPKKEAKADGFVKIFLKEVIKKKNKNSKKDA